jgi:hypothetical protein
MVEVVLSWPLEGMVEVVLSWPLEGMVEVVVGLSWPLEGMVVEVEVVGSSPWLTPHANTEPL